MTLNRSRFAAMNMVYNRFSFDYFLDSLERLNIKNFELWTGVPHLFPYIESMSNAKQIRSKVKDRNLKIVCVTPEQVLYPYNIASQNGELRNQSIDYFLRNMEMTVEMDCDKMLCCSGWGNYDENREACFERALDALQTMTTYAEKLGITLVFEVLSRFETNLSFNFEGTSRVLHSIQSPNLALCLDTVAVYSANDTLENYFNEFKGKIVHFHLTDGTPYGHVPLGEGNLPIVDILQYLRNSQYSGYITLEIGDTQWASNPEKATELAFDRLDTELSQLNDLS